ncbi:MAG: response regulator [bacterium]|nr:response regulator [bacterium]
MKNPIKAVIVDDEAPARESLETALERFEDIEIIDRCPNGYEAVKAVHQFRPDLLFLDINMPRLNGFDVVELLGKEAPFIIFVSAYDEYALRAFEADALDYLLKPVTPGRLEKSILRVREKLAAAEPQPMEQFIQRHQEHLAPLSRVLIREGSSVHIIRWQDIHYVEAREDFIKIHTAEKAYIKTDTMSNLEKKLDPQMFCRIHRSYLLNIDYLSGIEPYSKDSRVARLKDRKTLPISRSGYTRLLEMM